MSIRTATLFLSCVLLSATASAEMHSTEQAIESSTLSLRLPSNVPGSITVTPCDAGCAPVSLQVTAETRLFLGKKQVTLAELSKAVGGPTKNVSIYFEQRSRAASRIVVTDRRTP